MGGGGLSLIGVGTVILPNTGGRPVLAMIAFTSISIGALMLTTVLAFWIAKKIYSKA